MKTKTKKHPIVKYETTVTINGKRIVLGKMDYTISISQAIDDGIISNTKRDIIAFIEENI